MDRKIKKIIENIQRNHGSVESSKVAEKAIAFLLNKTSSWKQEEKTAIVEESLKQAYNHSLKPVTPQIIAVIILSALSIKRPELLPHIEKAFTKKLVKILRAYNLVVTTPMKNIHDRNMTEHTMNTTLLLSELMPDHLALTASLLKHLPEYGDVTIKQIKADFGEDVVEIINNVNRLRDVRSVSNKQSNEDIQQMLLAMSKDTRVIIIKICSLIDLLINIDQIHEKHKTRLATEAMNIYAPIADILGVWRLKWQLEDHAFRYLNPADYKKIEKKFTVDEKKNRKKYIEKTKNILTARAKAKNINCSMDGRFKHFYSIHHKMQEKQKGFNDLNDVFALRIIVDTEDDCYRMLGIIHSIWKSKSKRIKDYISNPKGNNYRSLHTTVYGLNDRLTEFQIRTWDMHDEARFGMASHWYYKNEPEKTPQWIKTVLQMGKQKTNNTVPWQTVNSKVLIDKIFVYTPNKDIIPLPAGATPIDFAYHIHSDVGNKCKHVKVNGELATMHQELKNEDVVEIITDQEQRPSEEWIQYAKTVQAQKAIKAYLDKED